MAFPESNRKAIIEALERLQFKLNSLENKNTDKVIQFDCQATYNESELLKKIKETEIQTEFLTEQIKKIFSRFEVAEKERSDLNEKIVFVERSQTQSCSDINKLLKLQENHLKTTQSQPILQNKKSTVGKQSQSELFSKAINCGAMSLERCTSPIFPTDLKTSEPVNLSEDSFNSAIHTNIFNPSNDFYLNDLPVNENDLNDPESKKNKYKFDFSNMPFTVGKSVSRSHSLMANFQEILFLMKQHGKISSTCKPSKTINTQPKNFTCTLQQQHLTSRHRNIGFQGRNSDLSHTYVKSTPKLINNHHQNIESQNHNMGSNEWKNSNIDSKLEKANCIDCNRKTPNIDPKLEKPNYIDSNWKNSNASTYECVRCGHRAKRGQNIRSRSAASFKLLKNIQKMQEALKQDEITWVP